MVLRMCRKSGQFQQHKQEHFLLQINVTQVQFMWSVINSANLCSILHVTYKVKIDLVALYPGGGKVMVLSVSMFTARIKLSLLSK